MWLLQALLIQLLRDHYICERAEWKQMSSAVVEHHAWTGPPNVSEKELGSAAGERLKKVIAAAHVQSPFYFTCYAIQT
jgi:hypothetical protein